MVGSSSGVAGAPDDEVAGPPLHLLAGELLVGIDALRLVPRLPGIVARRRARSVRDVLVIPGWLMDDRWTAVLRAVLTRDGHRVRGWERGRNHGEPGTHLRELTATVRRRAGTVGQPLDLVGWSLGGVFARRVAAAAPDAVRRVVTLGAPLDGPAGTAFGQGRNDGRRRPAPPPVPTTVVWSSRDGIVSRRSQLDEGNPWAEHVEVRARHVGLGLDHAALRVVRDRVAADVADALRPPTRVAGRS